MYSELYVEFAVQLLHWNLQHFIAQCSFVFHEAMELLRVIFDFYFKPFSYSMSLLVDYLVIWLAKILFTQRL